MSDEAYIELRNRFDTLHRQYTELQAQLAAERERCATIAEEEMTKGGVLRLAIVCAIAAAIRKGA